MIVSQEYLLSNILCINYVDKVLTSKYVTSTAAMVTASAFINIQANNGMARHPPPGEQWSNTDHRSRNKHKLLNNISILNIQPCLTPFAGEGGGGVVGEI